MTKHKIKNGEWWIGDCLELMKDIPDNSVDCIVTSPPYDNLRKYTEGFEWSYEIFKQVAIDLSRIISEGGVCVWNVGDATVKGSETGTSFRQAVFFKETCGLNIHDTMIWKKTGFSAVGALKTRYAPNFEYMFIFTKGSLKTFNQLRIDLTNALGRRCQAQCVNAMVQLSQCQIKGLLLKNLVKDLTFGKLQN